MMGEMSEEQGWHDHEYTIENVINPTRAWWQFWKPANVSLKLSMKIRAPKETPVHISHVQLEPTDD